MKDAIIKNENVENLKGVQNCFAVKDASSEIYPMRQFALLLLYNAFKPPMWPHPNIFFSVWSRWSLKNSDIARASI